MEVTKTVRCICPTLRESCSGDNFQHWKQERIRYSAYSEVDRKAKKMRSNEDLIDREETLEDRKCVVKVALAHLPFNEKREV